MDIIHGWFQSNFDVVFFVYGLAFFVMGLAILSQPRKESNFEIANIFWLLSMFGLIHGSHEWMEMWVIIKERGLVLDLIKWLFLATSYYFLFEFGRQFFEIMQKRYFLVNQKTVYLFAKGSLPVLSILILIFYHTIPDFTRLCTIWTRYLLCFPGGLLAGSMFVSYYHKEKEQLRPMNMGKYFYGTAVSLIVYGVLGGLVVPKADFFPANWLNTSSFFEAMQIPVQVFRAFCGIGVAWGIVGILKIFRWERAMRMENQQTELKDLNRALKAATDELSRSNADLSQFASIVSHDLKEPLRTVIGYAQLLEKRYKDKFDADAAYFIERVAQGGARMYGMVENLLSYSRVGTEGKAFTATQAAEALRRAIENLEAAIHESQSKITYDPLPEVLADPSQMTQLFQNLIANSIKFRSEEPPQIHVSSERKNGMWQFLVQDNGIGIDPKYNERIFEIFQRLHTQEEYSGAGVGLAVCKRIVERHGGQICVDSEPGKGSKFFFTIPDKK